MYSIVYARVHDCMYILTHSPGLAQGFFSGRKLGNQFFKSHNLERAKAVGSFRSDCRPSLGFSIISCRGLKPVEKRFDQAPAGLKPGGLQHPEASSARSVVVQDNSASSRDNESRWERMLLRSEHTVTTNSLQPSQSFSQGARAWGSSRKE